MKTYENVQMNITLVEQDIVTMSTPWVRPSKRDTSELFINGAPDPSAMD